MIARVWHGATEPSKADAYGSFLISRAIPDYRSTPGNRAVFVLRREEAGRCHFITLTLWDSWEAIRAFAGDDVEKAKYYPEDRSFLLEMEPGVVHHEVIGAELDAGLAAAPSPRRG
ncbi:MAG TPA: antibiotic biosynthesis monooxygenase [Candidatus Polarisedimenticolia bacterium]|nr:antibiotic biosynthesis monooxygenase [Candidatus Polarisedimenticolia bacterium]